MCLRDKRSLHDRASCVFCAFLANRRGRDIVYEDEEIAAFVDRKPRASVHYLVIPKEHIVGVETLTEEHGQLLGRMMRVSKEISRDSNSHQPARYGFHLRPFRSVSHLHLHCLVPPFRSWKDNLRYLPRSPWFITAEALYKKLTGESPLQLKPSTFASV
mmetsp:Transcript_5596/g.9674  ORF Transcript_5596/g.9674 Transcript_5596/m.9674 type:complete len:159 (+) Transcript_5596:247-723(+)